MLYNFPFQSTQKAFKMAISIQQRNELQRKIWSIADDVRGAVDGWDFKQYVLGSLMISFFISLKIGELSAKSA